MEQIELSRKQERILDALAESSRFWGSIRAKYAEFGALTARQFELFERDAARMEWQRGAQRIGDVAVRNKLKTAGKPRCAHREQPWCHAVASIVVGSWGYCGQHAPQAQEELDDWKGARNEERTQERAAEASGT